MAESGSGYGNDRWPPPPPGGGETTPGGWRPAYPWEPPGSHPWGGPGAWGGWTAPEERPPTEATEGQTEAASAGGGRRRRITLRLAALIAVLCGFGGGLAGTGIAHAVAGSPARSAVPPGTPAIVSSDPDARVLYGLIVRQSDVKRPMSVQMIPGGNRVKGQTTLDLCNGHFASEALRTARLQVAEVDPAGNVALSTEAVLYRSPAATVEAFAELRSVAASCPDRPVVSPVGEPTVTTRFLRPPGASWPEVAGVKRLVYNFDTTDQRGQTFREIAVYLRRGRVLEGVYFPQPSGPQPPVDGQTTIEGIVHIFSKRIAALPASVVQHR